MLPLLSLFLSLALAQEIPWKSVELEWEPVENAESYEVKLAPADGSKLHLLTTTGSHLTQEMPVGNYTLQIRSKAKNEDKFSAWSAGTLLEVAIKEIVPLNPPNDSVINTEGAGKMSVEFKWSPVDKVKEYTLKVWNESRKDNPWLFTGKNTAKKIDVPAGMVYFWQVSFESANETSYGQAPKVFSFTLQGRKLLRPEFQARTDRKEERWKSSPEARTYLVKSFFRHLDEKEWQALETKTVDQPFWPIAELKPGAYKLEVTASAPNHQTSATSEHEFLVKPTFKELAR